MKWAIQAKEEEKNKLQTFSADGWMGNQRSSQMWWRNEQELLSPEPRTARTSELNGSGGGRGKGIRGPRSFVPVGTTNRDKRGAFCPGWCLQPGQKAPVPPAGPASRWTRDKSHLLSRAQRLPGQMTLNKSLFCSSARARPKMRVVPYSPSCWEPRHPHVRAAARPKMARPKSQL